MYPHRIHLRGPWECEPIARTLLHADGRIETLDAPVPPPRRMFLPCQWAEGGLGPFNGRVRFRRRFHWPKPLGSHERLWLRFDAADYFADVRLNGEPLGRHEGAFDPFEFEITALVRERNDLEVEVNLPALSPDAPAHSRMFRKSSACPANSGGLWGVVTAEVRREWFLRGIQLWATFDQPSPVLHVAGDIVGESGRNLELYVLCDDRTDLYTRVESAGPFHVTTSQLAVDRWWLRGTGPARLHEIRVELVDGASKLHEFVRPFGFREIAGDAQAGVLTVNGREVRLQSDGPESNFMTIDMQGPASILYDRADREGVMVSTRLPIDDEVADAPARAEAERQARASAAELQFHPSIVEFGGAVIAKGR